MTAISGLGGDWAPISVLVVNQENVTATLSSVLGRCFGTLHGVSVALLVHRVGTGASPVSLAPGGVVPHIIIRSPRLRLGEFEAHVLKRLLQHDLHEPEVDPAAPDVCYQG